MLLSVKLTETTVAIKWIARTNERPRKDDRVSRESHWRLSRMVEESVYEEMKAGCKYKVRGKYENANQANAHKR